MEVVSGLEEPTGWQLHLSDTGVSILGGRSCPPLTAFSEASNCLKQAWPPSNLPALGNFLQGTLQPSGEHLRCYNGRQDGCWRGIVSFYLWHCLRYTARDPSVFRDYVVFAVIMRQNGTMHASISGHPSNMRTRAPNVYPFHPV